MNTLTKFSAYLGKYYPELLYSATQEKYKSSFLDGLFDQRFRHQDNKPLMILDPTLSGLSLVVSGNEILVSPNLYNHSGVEIINSMDADQTSNPKSLYSPENFGSVAYLVCPNQVSVRIKETLPEPIYVKYTGEYECFFHSVVFFYISEGIDIDIVEEIESLCSTNIVSNYVLFPRAALTLSTFYKNRVSANSIVYRNVVSQENTVFEHKLLGKSSAGIIDETKLHPYQGSSNNFYGIVDAHLGNFHSIVYVEPINHDYKILVDYKNLPRNGAKISFYPVIVGQEPNNAGARISVQDLEIDRIPTGQTQTEIESFIRSTLDAFRIKKLLGTERYYENKSKFMVLP